MGMSNAQKLYRDLFRVVAYAKDIEEVRSVLRDGADPNFPKTDEGCGDYTTVLHHAAIYTYSLSVEKVVCLVTEGGCVVDITDREGCTPLIVASRYPSRLKVVAKLLSLKADPNIISRNGATALSEAAGSSSPEMVALLLEGGADVNPGFDTQPPLCLAVANGRKVSIVRMLLEHGADPNLRDAKGYTPLHYAVRIEMRKAVVVVVDLLLLHGADLFALDPTGRTPLEVAGPEMAAYLRPLVAKWLMRAARQTSVSCLPDDLMRDMIRPLVARP